MTTDTKLKTLPFLTKFVPALRSGRKVDTTRTRRYGDPGDQLQTKAGVIVLLSVERVALAQVKMLHFWTEGFDTPDEFEQAWRSIHPHSLYDPEQLVWLHRFALVKEVA